MRRPELGRTLRRVLIVGPCGAGKSTLAGRLAPRLRLPLVHLDREYWLPGWREPCPRVWRQRVESLVSAPAWLMDGNFGNSLELRLRCADAAIFLDLPRRLCLARVLLRISGSFGRVRPDMAPACPEQLDLAFLSYVWRFHRVQRPRLIRALRRHADRVRVIRLRRVREVSRLVQTTCPEV